MTNNQTAYEPRLRDTPFPLMEVGTLFRNVSEKVDPHLYEPLSVGQLGVTPQLEGVAQQQGAGEKKLVRPGQIAMNSRSDRRGASGLSEYEGVVSVVYTVLQPDLDYVYPRFAHHLFRSLDFQNEYYRWGTGIVDDLWSTKFERLAQIRIPLPNLETQRRIADYLDKEISEMEALIKEFEGLVNSLGIRKRLLSDSIFDEKVPRIALKFLADFIPGFAFPSTSFTDDSNYTFLFRGVNLKPGIIDSTDSLYFDGLIEVPERYILQEGDVVLGMDRPFIKSGVRVATIPQEFEGSYLVQRVLKVKGRKEAYNRLFAYILSSSRFIDHITPDFTGISVPHLSAEQVGSFSVPLLSESEAQRVVERLDSDLKYTNSLIEESTRLIENLKARKTALITEVVTGRKEV